MTFIPNISEKRHILNFAFELQEVLFSTKDKSSLRKGFLATNPFNSDPGVLILKEHALRDKMVRIRTISNASDAMCILCDGTPISELSIYGSRESIYVAGPYSAYKRLINGDIPPKVSVTVTNTLSDRAILQKTFSDLSSILNEVSTKGGVIRNFFEGKQHQFQRSDIAVVSNFLKKLELLIEHCDVISEDGDTALQKPRTGVRVWWSTWSEPHFHKVEPVSEVMSKYQIALDRFLVDLYP